MRLLVALGLLAFSAVVLAASVSSSSSASGWLANPAIPVLAAVAVGLAAVDQFLYVRRKGSLPGPAVVPPFLGFLHRSLTPTFEGYIKQWNMGALSCTSVLHKFIVFATSNELSRKTFNTPEIFTPAGPASMRTVLCPENWVFLQGQEHVDYRKKLVPLFTRAALSAYLPLQQEAYKYNITKWLKDGEGGKEIEMMGRIRDLNMTTSLGVFCGMRYLPDNADVELSEAYRIITYAFQLVNIPFAIPGTAVYDAVCAREKIMHYLMIASEKSHERYAKGEKPESLLDRWVEALEKERADWEAGGRKGKEPRKFTHREIALTVMTMIFASQDASTSSVVWSVQTLADHPHVLQLVREEQKALRPNNEPLTYETMRRMEYTWRVVKELLRYRPPVTMMLYEAKQQTDLGGHPIDKGTLVVASVYPSLHDPKVFVNPEKFDPDRFLSEDPVLQQNYMVWGHGPHTCIGRDYAMSHLVAFIAYLSTTCDWEHIVTPDSQKIMIIATLYPADKCRIKIKPRAV